MFEAYITNTALYLSLIHISVKGSAAAGGARGTLDGFLPVMLFPGQATGI